MSSDQNAKHSLFRKHWLEWQPHIYAYIRTLVFERSQADDLLQEVAATLWEKLDQFEPGTRFDQWAYAVARNKLRNHRRKLHRERLLFSDELTEILSAEALSSQDQTQEELDALESCVGELTRNTRNILQLRFEKGATNRSVANQIGRSESSISRALTKAYQTLLACVRVRLRDQANEGGQV